MNVGKSERGIRHFVYLVCRMKRVAHVDAKHLPEERPKMNATYMCVGGKRSETAAGFMNMYKYTNYKQNADRE